MAARRYNPRLAKIHLNYTVSEVADLYETHSHTVRNWIKAGLPALMEQKPWLILGQALFEFHQTNRVKNKQTCRPGEIYCVRCRVPKQPADRMADYQPTTDKLGALIGLCPDCGLLMYRRASLAKLAQIQGDLEVKITQAKPHINESL